MIVIVRLDVVADGVLAEGQVLREVVGRCAGDVGRRGQILRGVSRNGIDILQNGQTDCAECRDCVSGIRLPAKGVRPVPQVGVGSARAVRGVAGVWIVDLAGVAAEVDVAVGDVVIREWLVVTVEDS